MSHHSFGAQVAVCACGQMLHYKGGKMCEIGLRQAFDHLLIFDGYGKEIGSESFFMATGNMLC